MNAPAETPDDADPELVVLALAGKCGNEYCPYPDARVSIGPHPYNQDMFGDHTPVALCEHCRADAAQDI